MMIILCISLTGPWDAQIFGQALFGVSMCVFWVRLTFKWVNRVKQIALNNAGDPNLII